MKKAILILIVWLPACMYAQELKDKSWILKLNAAQAIDIFSFPSVQLAAERKINPWVSVGADVGVQVYEFYEPDTVFLNSKGFKTSIEGRVYLPKFKKGRTIANRGEVYIGLQFFYNQNQTTDVIEYSPSNDSTKIITDYFGTKITAKGINLIFGYQVSFGKLVLEPFAGVGMVHRKVKDSDIEFDEAKHKKYRHSQASYSARFDIGESTGLSFNICTGFRIGYRL
jgi:hypothetical protein